MFRTVVFLVRRPEKLELVHHPRSSPALSEHHRSGREGRGEMEPSDVKVWFSQTRLYRHKHTLSPLSAPSQQRMATKGQHTIGTGYTGIRRRKKKVPPGKVSIVSVISQ